MIAETDTEDLIVEIPSDEIELGHDADGLPKTVPAKKAKEETDEEPAKPRKKPDTSAADLEAAQERIAAAERVAAAERTAREKAERDLSERTGHGLKAHLRAVDAEHRHSTGELNQIVSGIGSTKEMLDRARRDLASCDTSEPDGRVRAADLTSEIGILSGQLATLEQGKLGAEAMVARTQQALEDTQNYLSESAKAAPRETRDAPQQPATPDAWIASVRSQVGGKVADWFDNHREYVTNPKLNAKALKFAEAYAAVEEKPLNSQAFIDAMNDKFDPQAEIEEVEEEAREEAEPPKPKARKAPAAPVSRNSNFFSSRNPNGSKIKLPADVATFVKQAGLDPTQYALGVLDDIRAGRKPKEWLDPDFPRFS